MTQLNNITLIAAVNNHSVLESNLLRSPLLKHKNVQFIPAENFTSASQAYNYGIANATGKFLVFAHQDVYIPAPWLHQMDNAINFLEKKRLPWAVLGAVGVDGSGIVKGRCWSTGLGREVGVSIREPEPAVSVDELIIIVRKRSGLTFDNNLPGWHLYGTDIVQEALKQDFGAYIIHAPVIHNSLPVLSLDAGFVECSRYLQRKWTHRLPIQTCCIRLTRFGWPLLYRRIRQLHVALDSRDSFSPLPDPVIKAQELMYE
ncbi:MAG: hypothetical protein ACWGKN_17885 [Desulfoprunum sp.]